MALHHQLRALVERLGVQVLEDSDSLRGALDDYLDEGTASRGEINLLVDTVRLGAYGRLTAMVDSGAAVSAAVTSAGDSLARERGSADLAGSRWAVAALGFAAARVPEAEVQRWDPSTEGVPQPGHQPGPQPPHQPGPQPPHQPGPQPPYQPGPQQPYQQPYQGFGQSHGAPPGPQQGYGDPRYGYGQAPQRKRSAAPLLIAAAVLVLLALVGGGVWWALSGDDDGGGGGGGDEAGGSYDEAAYCEAYRAADEQFNSSDFSTIDGSQFDDLQNQVSEIKALAPPEVADEWQTLEGALNQFESILNDAGLTFDDLDELSSGQIPEGVTAAELEALSTRLTEFSESAEFETAGDAIDQDAQTRCDIPTDGGAS